jgi:uncharacterized phage-associated protein
MKNKIYNDFVKLFKVISFQLLPKFLKKCYATDINDRLQEEENGMASVFDVAKYILHHAGAMTTMKLEKLVYYSQAWSLAWDGKPLFDNDFEAWANGPVCPELFHSHQGQYTVPSDFYDGKGHMKALDSDAIETIDAVLRDYGDKDSQWLSDLTHKERPWREARQGVSAGMRSTNIVSKEIMQEYYGGL